jgi:ribose 5-phosphate isomerase B
VRQEGYNGCMIYIAADHAGVDLKEVLKKYIAEELGREVEDMGAFEKNEEDDYPDFVIPAAQKVALRQVEGDHDTVGIVIGGSGQGEAIAANKVHGIRAVVYYGGNTKIGKLARQHNNANVLSLGARFVSEKEAKEVVKLWLETEFEGERHERRIQKISEFDQCKE